MNTVNVVSVHTLNWYSIEIVLLDLETVITVNFKQYDCLTVCRSCPGTTVTSFLRTENVASNVYAGRQRAEEISCRRE